MPASQNQSMTVLRWMGAVGITLAPLGVFVLPGLMYPEPFETAEEQFTAFAESAEGGYAGLLVQVSGVVCLMVAALGRTGMVPIVVPLLFVLPVLLGFVPLPVDPTVLSGLLLLVPCLWMTVQLIRGVPASPINPLLPVRASDHA